MWKKWIGMGLCVFLLTGCAQSTFETLGDVQHQNVVAPAARKIQLDLPQDTILAVWEREGDSLYMCRGYTVHLQTLDGGDLEGTIRSLSGFEKDGLTVLQTVCGDHSRYEWVWTAAGEGGDVICRSAVWDDGDFHYGLTLMADASVAGSLTAQWNELMASFCLEE